MMVRKKSAAVKWPNGCLNCGEPREIVRYGLCFACYGKVEKQPVVADRHNPAIRRDHKRLFRAFTNVMVGLGDLGVSKAGVLAIREVIEPYLSPITQFLLPVSEHSHAKHLAIAELTRRNRPASTQQAMDAPQGNSGTAKREIEEPKKTADEKDPGQTAALNIRTSDGQQ